MANKVLIVLKWNDVRAYGEEVIAVFDELGKARSFITGQEIDLKEIKCSQSQLASWEYEHDSEKGFAIEEHEVR